jgi:hypothetical protein
MVINLPAQRVGHRRGHLQAPRATNSMETPRQTIATARKLTLERAIFYPCVNSAATHFQMQLASCKLSQLLMRGKNNSQLISPRSHMKSLHSASMKGIDKPYYCVGCNSTKNFDAHDFERHLETTKAHRPAANAHHEQSFRCRCGWITTRRDKFQKHVRNCINVSSSSFKCKCGKEVHYQKSDATQEILDHVKNGHPKRRGRPPTKKSAPAKI